jgi:hypothetical protein
MTYILTTLGTISIMWSAISLVLNTFIEWNQARTGTVPSGGFPRHFTMKLRYLKKVEKDEFWTPEQRTEMRAIRLELGRLNSTRVELAHGLVHMTGVTDDVVIHIAKEEGSELLRRRVDKTYSELRKFRNELSQMIGRLTALYNPILGFDDEG